MPLLEPRILYGLKERFALIPYVMGARSCRLVLRVSALQRFLTTPGVLAHGKPVPIGAPLVLGELLERRKSRDAEPVYIMTGGALDALKYTHAEWAVRRYRAVPMPGTCVSFEVGSSSSYSARTAYFPIDKLLSLVQKEMDHGKEQGKDLPTGRGPPLA